MGKIYISFDYSCQFDESSSELFEKVYQNTCKKLISFLYSHPKCCFSFYFSGFFLEWLEKKHEEMISILTELTSRKQVEILGGGFYDPIFPFILPIDRVGQIEKLTTLIRKTIGKKPRGIKLIHSIWNSSLISSLKTCSFDYVQLDYRLIPQATMTSPYSYLPFIIEDLGKTITVMPLHQERIPTSQISPADYLKQLINLSKKNGNIILCCSFSPENIQMMFNSNNWFENFFQLVEESDLVEFTTSSKFLRNQLYFNPTSIPSGTSPEIMQWVSEPYMLHIKNVQTTDTVRKFFLTYPESYALYSRMMYSCLVVDQCKGDKIRKKSARESIWEAQQNSAFLYLGKKGIADREIRKNAYRHLLLAEKTARDPANYVEVSHSLDVNMDGIPEYIFRFSEYNAFISLIGGTLFELDIFYNLRNYTDTMNRILHFDKAEDLYLRRMFVDHIIENHDFDNFIKDSSNIKPVFANLLYTTYSFDRTRHEVQMFATGNFGSLNQPVFIRKKYVFTSSGVQVQYIIKNASPFPLKACFAVESNIEFDSNTTDDLKIELIAADVKEEACPDQLFIRQKDVSHVQLTDKTSDITFNFQPNENAGICFQQLNITRPINGKNETKYQATTCYFFWNIDIAPSLEIEKTLFMSIQTPDNRSKTKRKKSNT